MKSEQLSLRKPVRIIEVRFLIIMCLISSVKCQMEPFVVGGFLAPITLFPHAALINFHCFDDDNDRPWICGASIINQWITLTAAHCVSGCARNSTVSVSVGNSNKNQGVESLAHSYYIHENYDEELLSSDIALVRLKKTIQFNERVKRVVLMKKPPYFEKAQVAGWGIINEEHKTPTDQLKYIDQIVISGADCKKFIPDPPYGTICANSQKKSDYSTDQKVIFDEVELVKKTRNDQRNFLLTQINNEHQK